MKRRFFCVVCGYNTLETQHDWDICPICYWEDDVVGDVDTTSSANEGMWISEAQANFTKFGAVSERLRSYVRPPNKNDIRRPDFIPFPRRPRLLGRKPVRSRSSRFPKEYEKYLRERILPVLTPIDDTIANLVIAQILFLNMEDKRKPIHLFVDSPGGYVNSCLAIYDTVTRGKGAPIYSYGLQHVGGLAALIVAGGARGHRACLPVSQFTLAACSGGKAEEAIDIPRINAKVEEEFAKTTGQTTKQLHQDMIERRELDADSAIAYGLVDRVVVDIPAPRT